MSALYRRVYRLVCTCCRTCTLSHHGRHAVTTSLPALSLVAHDADSHRHPRYYVQGITDTWPTKEVFVLDTHAGTITVSRRMSRRFINGALAGDLGGLVLQLSPPELEYISGHTIGWVTRYVHSANEQVGFQNMQHDEQTVTIIEVDPAATGQLSIDSAVLTNAYSLVDTPEQRLDKFLRPDKPMFPADEFRENFILSRLLMLEQDVRRVIEYQGDDPIDIMRYVHVNGSPNSAIGLGPVDETVSLQALGSRTASNKLRSALSISAKSRLRKLHECGSSLCSVIQNVHSGGHEHISRGPSRFLYGGMNGLYVRTNIPWDSIIVTFVCVTGVIALHWVFSAQWTGVKVNGYLFMLNQTIFLVFAPLIIAWVFHEVRYNAWPLADTMRLRRLCHSDEDVGMHMERLTAVRTIADAGAAQVPMDGANTCAVSNLTNGRFQMLRPLPIDETSAAGLRLRIDTGLRPVWVDFRGMRALRIDRRDDVWHAHGPYLAGNYLEIGYVGPSVIGAPNPPQ